MSSKLFATLSISILLAFITLCGAPSAFAAPTDACSLLTPAQVTAALGVNVGAGQPAGPKNAAHPASTSSSLCGWSEPGNTAANGKKVLVDIFGNMGSLSPTDRFNNAKTPVKGITKTPVSDVADDAYYIVTPGLGPGLNVKKGNFVFQIRVSGFSVDQNEAMEKTLAQNILAKL
jgi:hypothetical protein